MPSNQPAGQAPLTSAGEREVLCKELGVPEGDLPAAFAGIGRLMDSSVTVLDKTLPQGDQAAPFFTWLASQTPLNGGFKFQERYPGDKDFMNIDGNFNKFLIDAKGNLLKRYRNFDEEWDPFAEESEILATVGADIQKALSDE